MEKTERYNYVFDQYDGDSFIYDLKEDKRIEDLSECADILNKKEKEIERWFYHKKVDAQINRELIDEIEELEFALVDENRKRQEYEVALECACDELDYASDVLSDCHADDCNLHTKAGYFVNKAIRELK